MTDVRVDAACGGALFLLLLVLCAPVVALAVDRNPALFVLDEFAYADYLHKLDDGHWVVRHGELSGQSALRALACRGSTDSPLTTLATWELD